MTKVNLISVKDNWLLGEQVPETLTDGERGQWIQQQFDQNHIPTQNQKGPDLSTGQEIKSRKKESSSAHTIGTTTEQHILDYDWTNNDISKKMEEWCYTEVSSTFSVVTKHVNIKWSKDTHVSHLIETAFNDCRQQFINGDRKKYIRSECRNIIFEKCNRPKKKKTKEDCKNWQIRIPGDKFKILYNMSQQKLDLFDGL
jgi:hypothetical protein